MKSATPYSELTARSYWRPAVAQAGIFGLRDLWRSPWPLPQDAWFATFGSCFAQHISQNLVARNLNWLNAEPAPERLGAATARRFNYGIFSARTGNIYTARQLAAWVALAARPETVDALEIWADDAAAPRYRPALAPVIEPEGYGSEAEARAALAGTARAFHRAIAEADVFVFTLGLTEGWIHRETAAPYAMCPGTIAGVFDPEQHVFENAGYPEIRASLEASFAAMRAINPALRVLLTVSPVPLTATATDQHVLPATTYSKATLRAVAGDLAAAADWVDYFPSYEIIAAPPTRGAFFAPNMRSVEAAGVALVMEHFFAGLDLSAPPRQGRVTTADPEAIEAALAEEDLVCEEAMLDAAHGA